ncbi:hypothetical protein skT53_24870 [Effusibacillus dendaii]|uniref:Alkyl hydroperoxide reductase subunit C/ Thiol specific antioxidant domain-containing protein n=1 Tax=Effusibacillus dendaii TaxID=2743772 RepID=A0A7I8DDZ5_9BACL|nr:hypothetical protein skT53_24870 [Effusibacillus dendaii]
MRDHAAKYQELGVSILVIAGQKIESARQWLSQHPLPFPFLVEADRSVIISFDVYNPIHIDAFRIAHPSMFLISADGKIVYAYVGKNQRDRPTDEETYLQVHQLLADTFIE